MAYLDDHEPARSQFRCPRRERPSGVMVIHTAENTPDLVAFDGGAEAVARFIAGRSDAGSYHDLADSDSLINLVRYSCEAYQDGTGSNPHAWGGSVATRADVWPLAPQAWRDGAVTQLAAAAARYARWIQVHHGITVPARRINRAQSEARIPGFISHAERDPGRRSDPGAAFPWQQFLDAYAHHMGQEDDPLAALTDAEQRELLRLARTIEDRTQRHLTLDRDQFLDPDHHEAGRANAKTLVTGAGLDALRERTDDRPNRGAWRAEIEGIVEGVVNRVLDDRLGPAEPTPTPPAG